MTDINDPGTDRRGEGIPLQLAAGIDRHELTAAVETLIGRLAADAGKAERALGSYATDMAAIISGESDIDPAEDPRFSDPDFADIPFYQRVAQAYIAWSRALDIWLDDLGMSGIEARRARFVAGMLKDIAAPVNAFQLNPSAIRTFLESEGKSLNDGLDNYLDDLQHNHGYPAVADREGFTIGLDVAATPGKVVFRDELLELIQYTPVTGTVKEIPFLYVFSQVNRFYLGDLTPDRSLFAELLAAGIPVFAISWQNPTVEQGHWDLARYVSGVIKALAVTRDVSGAGKVNVMGLCAGGITTTAAAALLAARGDDWINSHSLFVNILDNQPEDSDFGLFVTPQSIAAQKARIRAKGLFDEKDVFELFALLTPEESVMAFYRDNWLMGKAPPVHPLLFWSMDYTRVPAALQCDYLDLSLDNAIAHAELIVDGHRLDPGCLNFPTYVMAGSTDHITPWRGCYRSVRLFSGEVTFVLTNQNHTQTISNKQSRHLRYWLADDLPDDPDAWLAAAVEHTGSWRQHWIAWLAARSGQDVPARVPGSADWPALDDAPGHYVRAK